MNRKAVIEKSLCILREFKRIKNKGYFTIKEYHSFLRQVELLKKELGRDDI